MTTTHHRRILAAALLLATIPLTAAGTPTLAETVEFITREFPRTQPVDRRPTYTEASRIAIEDCMLTVTTRRYSAVASCKAEDLWESAAAFADDYEEQRERSIPLTAVTGARHQALLRRITVELEPTLVVRERITARRRPPNTGELTGQCVAVQMPDQEIVGRDLQIGVMNPDRLGDRLAEALAHAARLCRARQDTRRKDSPF